MHSERRAARHCATLGGLRDSNGGVDGWEGYKEAFQIGGTSASREAQMKPRSLGRGIRNIGRLEATVSGR